MIFRNSIVGKMVVQFGIFTSQGNNIFVGGFPGTLQASDVVCPVISSLSAASGERCHRQTLLCDRRGHRHGDADVAGILNHGRRSQQGDY